MRDLRAFAQKEGELIDSTVANQSSDGYLITNKSWRLGLGVISGVSVLACCFISQLIAAQAKKSKLKLNKYYSKKKYEKDQLIQYISREQLLYALNPHSRQNLSPYAESQPGGVA